MKRISIAFLSLFLCVASVWSMPRPEYPRPQFERSGWVNLNGEWTCSFDFGGSGMEREFYKSKGFDKKITVPFCPESKLSGIGYTDFINHFWFLWLRCSATRLTSAPARRAAASTRWSPRIISRSRRTFRRRSSTSARTAPDKKVLQNTAFYGKIPVYINDTGKQRNFFIGGSL